MPGQRFEFGLQPKPWGGDEEVLVERRAVLAGEAVGDVRSGKVELDFGDQVFVGGVSEDLVLDGHRVRVRKAAKEVVADLVACLGHHLSSFRPSIHSFNFLRALCRISAELPSDTPHDRAVSACERPSCA